MKRNVTTIRLSYASTEVGGQLIFCVLSFYLLKFYTDVFGISAAAAGFILLAARCFDAVDAPLWGIVFDKTSSRFGKSRPWFLWLCVPFALAGVLTFCTPPLSERGKILYALCTYVACSVLYTGINTPVTSILSGLTPDSGERITLTSFRMFGSKAGVLFVNLTLLNLVSRFGHGNSQRGFMTVMPIYACGTVGLYLLAFRNLQEDCVAKSKPLALRQSFAALRGNAPWLIIFLSSLFFWIAFIARITSAPYFFEYVLHRSDLTPIANSFDAASLASILLLPYLCRRFSKRTLWAVSLIGSVLAQIWIHFGVTGGSINTVLGGWLFGFVISGIALAIPFSVLSDSVDFGEWKSGVRAAGMLTAVGAAFCLKAGSGLGGALSAWLLARFGYVPNVQQSARSLTGIEISFIWLPALFYGLALIPVLFYHRYERLEGQIHEELAARRLLAAEVSASV
jgi:sugar (glycoside-pentoside-hexuronide) transporter